ncbi:TPA: helix-turn-helix domain-containing protein [Pseudomonas aeruginosa]|nr:helix-turn-helix domain-containing protein [Pseudomonas aeruginosa]HCC4919938.1 helix-turn-helix domain-containing protein [Pseudomonas aeruginosa]
MPRASKVTDPSYELMDDHEGHSLIYRQHGFPSPLVRWHFHKEYELHLIVASSGKVFIGDYIGNFAPDTLFLTGPNLPHNWISQVEPDEVVARRDMLVNFTDEVLEDGSGVFSELNRLAPLLARARYGIEFRDPALIGESRRLLQRIADSGGMLPVTEVCFESGFSNLSNFNRRFQQLKGMTPTGYRRLVTQRLTEQNLL